MILRDYQDPDFDQLITLLKDAGTFYEPCDRKEVFSKKIEIDPGSIIIAEEDGLVLGTVFIIYDPFQSFVYHLSVHPGYQRKGVGGRLMDEAEKRLKGKGVHRPTLFVEEENSEVVAFYKKKGWFVLYKVYCMEKELDTE